MAASEWVCITTAGRAREMGRQYGEQAREAIRSNVAAFGTMDTEWDDASALREILSELAPEVLEEIEGMAEGSGVSTDALIRLNHVPLHPLAACTPMAIADGPDGPLVAKNNDCHPQRAFAFVIRRSKPDKGLPMLQVTYAGWLSGLDALNGAGLGNTHASVGSAFDRRGRKLDIRLRVYQLMRTCRTTIDFIDGLASGPSLTGKGFNIALVDGEGMTALVEAAVPLVSPRDLSAPFVYATNHYASEALRDSDQRTPDRKRISINRLGYLDWRAQATPPRGIDDLQSLLSSHEPWAPCRHGGAHGVETEWSMIAVPRECRILLASGSPCSTPYNFHEIQ
jgi:predicted choloylglycine hydrolase